MIYVNMTCRHIMQAYHYNKLNYYQNKHSIMAIVSYEISKIDNSQY